MRQRGNIAYYRLHVTSETKGSCTGSGYIYFNLPVARQMHQLCIWCQSGLSCFVICIKGETLHFPWRQLRKIGFPPFRKDSTLKGKKCLPLGANFFVFE